MDRLSLLPLVTVGGVLLLASGLVKLREPASARTALRALGVPAARASVALIAVFEVVLGAAAVFDPVRAVGGSIAAVYLAFAIVIERQRRVPDVFSCGCLGARSAPPSRVHTVVNLALCGGAAAAAVYPTSGMVTVVAAHPVSSLPVLVGVAAAAALAAAAITHLPVVLGAYSRVPM